MIYEQIIRIAIGEKGEPLLKVIDSCNEVCLKVISTVMYFTPIGVFCTIVPVVEANGTSTIVSHLLRMMEDPEWQQKNYSYRFPVKIRDGNSVRKI